MTTHVCRTPTVGRAAKSTVSAAKSTRFSATPARPCPQQCALSCYHSCVLRFFSTRSPPCSTTPRDRDRRKHVKINTAPPFRTDLRKPPHSTESRRDSSLQAQHTRLFSRTTFLTSHTKAVQVRAVQPLRSTSLSVKPTSPSACVPASSRGQQHCRALLCRLTSPRRIAANAPREGGPESGGASPARSPAPAGSTAGSRSRCVALATLEETAALLQIIASP